MINYEMEQAFEDLKKYIRNEELKQIENRKMRLEIKKRSIDNSIGAILSKKGQSL
jgi:hypothetical protein